MAEQIASAVTSATEGDVLPFGATPLPDGPQDVTLPVKIVGYMPNMPAVFVVEYIDNMGGRLGFMVSRADVPYVMPNNPTPPADPPEEPTPTDPSGDPEAPPGGDDGSD